MPGDSISKQNAKRIAEQLMFTAERCFVEKLDANHTACLLHKPEIIQGFRFRPTLKRDAISPAPLMHKPWSK